MKVKIHFINGESIVIDGQVDMEFIRKTYRDAITNGNGWFGSDNITVDLSKVLYIEHEESI